MCPIRKANPYRRMAKALKTSNVADNLVKREFEKHGPRAILLTDITYMLYLNSQKAYLSTVLDACTKQVLAYAVSNSLEVDFVLETVKRLIQEHGISLSKNHHPFGSGLPLYQYFLSDLAEGQGTASVYVTTRKLLG